MTSSKIPAKHPSMPRISVLPDTLASQVAAGEVVERPASVLKEVVENALDAGATHIDVETRKGGVALLKISDNGHGMDRENALLSLERHATSKLQNVEGLGKILTHGFRGEALPSISSVARFRLTTNHDTHTPATEIYVEGGTVNSIEEVARAVGTTIEVKDIFYNVPARRKFLKSEATEYAHLEQALRLSALGNPSVRYTFKNNSRLIWDLKPTTERRTRIAELNGYSILEQLKEVQPFSMGDITVSGYLLPGRLSRGSGKAQTVFINNRPVDDSVVRAAIREGYHGHIQPGQFPVLWLWVTMPPDQLDVNVHPAKREVRFTHPTEVKHVIAEGIATTLSMKPRPALAPPPFLNPAPQPSKTPGQSSSSSPASPAIEAPSSADAPVFEKTTQWSTPDQSEIPFHSVENRPKDHTGSPSQSSTPPTPPTPPTTPSALAHFTFLAVLHDKLWLLEDETGLVILHPKAARERITYDTLKHAYRENTLNSQPLLIPILVELDGHDQNTLKHYLPVLDELGIELSNFGGNTFQLNSLPTLLDLHESPDAESFLLGVIDELEKTSTLRTAQAKERALESLLRNLAHQSGKRQNTEANLYPALITELMATSLPYCTPEGKPTMAHHATTDLLRKLT